MKNETTTILEGSCEIIPCGYACEALSFLQQIYHSAPIGMLALDENLSIIRLNQRMADFFAAPLEEIPGRSIDQFSQALSSKLKAITKEVLLQKNPIQDLEISFRHHENDQFWKICAYPISYEAACATAVNVIIHDISELRHTQIRLENSLNSLSHLQERLKEENLQLQYEISKTHENSRIIGSSKPLLEINHQILQVAPTDSTVLISGATGTGKELVAGEIHRLSKRAARPMIIVNCAAMPANLIESELFGHEKGSFTGAIAKKIGRFEVANGGTIFLDEIGEMPLELQSKLLRVLQEQQLERIGSSKTINIDVRVIAATNRDLAKETVLGRFREDLFFRLNVFPIHLPPLSERGTDIIAIAEDFLLQCNHKLGRRINGLSDSSKNLLLHYSWPGNIRELKNAIERAAILCKSDTLEIEVPQNPMKTLQDCNLTPDSGLKSLQDVEKAHVLKILQITSWRIRGQGGAAEILRLKPTTLESRMLKLGIKRNKPVS